MTADALRKAFESWALSTPADERTNWEVFQAGARAALATPQPLAVPAQSPAEAHETQQAQIDAIRAQCWDGPGLGARFDYDKFGRMVWDAALAHLQPKHTACDYCDGTGDVHRADGEWLGECNQCPAAALHAFKNFHRLLCERFGYGHDEKDWRRDQLSLIEFIAAKAQAPAPAPDHVPAGKEVEDAVDAKLGIKLLPPIRVPAVTAALIEKFAALEGLIVQAIVRDALVERFSAQAPAVAHATGRWTVISPDGKVFTGESAHRAANEANKHLRATDPVEAKKWADMLDRLRAENEAENERLLAEHGTLDCPACGGSGHIGDVVQGTAEAHELVRMVLEDMATCYGDCGADYQFKELSTETVEALEQYKRAASLPPVQPMGDANGR